jgi:hypothetical protein
MSDLLPRGVTSVTVRFKRDQQVTKSKPKHGAKTRHGNERVCGRMRRKTETQERELEADGCRQNQYTQTTFIEFDGVECVTQVRTDDGEDDLTGEGWFPDLNEDQQLDLPPPSSPHPSYLRSCSLRSSSLCPYSIRPSLHPSSLHSSLRPSSAGTTSASHSPIRATKTELRSTSFEIRRRTKTAASITPVPLVSLSSLHEYDERMRMYGHARAGIIPTRNR